MIFFPVLNPKKDLVKIIYALIDLGVSRKNLCVIDDGSNEGLNFLNDLKKIKIHIIHHEKNFGKGRGIKTALKFAKENNIRYSIFADSDNQHDVDDIFKVYLLSKSKNINERKLIVAQRNFEKKMPFTSKFGNSFVTFLINLFYKQKFSDTQCGLRLIPYKLYNHFLLFDNDGYDFEMKCFIYCLKKKNLKTDIFIKSIYTKERYSHFKKIKDSYKVLKQIFKYDDF